MSLTPTAAIPHQGGGGKRNLLFLLIIPPPNPKQDLTCFPPDAMVLSKKTSRAGITGGEKDAESLRQMDGDGNPGRACGRAGGGMGSKL